jgi:hypothetical protein
MTNGSMTADDSRPPRIGGDRSCRVGLTVAVALGLAWTDGAAAFPLIDPTNLDQVPHGTELSAPDASDLRHQLQLVNGLGAPAGGGWTFVPRFDYQAMLTDNVQEQHNPRRADLVSYFSPGFSLAGDLPRATVSLYVAPTLALYARTGSLNALTEQLNGIASVTLVPDLAFVDVRALAGVQNAFGGIGGDGTVGASAGGAASAQGTIPSLAGNGQGLTKDNEVQSSSASISPYLLRNFGDWGTGRLGYSWNVTRSDKLSGFASSPFPTGGADSQTLVSNEQTAHFVTGEILDQFQDAFDVDLLQTQITAEPGSVNGDTGSIAASTTHTSSSRQVVSDQVTYRVNRNLAVFASGGHEDIVYTGANATSIHDLTWSLGATLTPGPDSQLTVSYGHQNGFNSASISGFYPLTQRTLLTVAYGSTLGTQLENLRNQLNVATTNGNGTLVSGQNGGQLFGGTNALPVENGVFRTDTLSLGTQTTLDRDIITFNLLMAKQTSTGGTASSSGTSKTFNTTWVHQMRPDMILNASLSYSIQDQTVQSGLNPGNSTSMVASVGWQWQISDTTSASVRYSLFERHAAVAAFDIYQNMLILGVSKTF